MLIIRGVNVFPTQIETVLLKFGEVEPHYMILIDRVHNLDVMEIQIEMSPRFFSDSIKDIENTERGCGTRSPRRPGSQPRSHWWSPSRSRAPKARSGGCRTSENCKATGRSAGEAFRQQGSGSRDFFREPLFLCNNGQ
jgi:hypothetical protein